MSIKKQYFKNKSECKVTFRLPKEAVGVADKVYLVGDFNNWDRFAMPMKKLKNGHYIATVNLETAREYQFRYLIDGTKWENDRHADKYVPSPHAYTDNSVIVV